MPQIHPAVREYEIKRWMRPDAYRFIRPDWRRFVVPGSELAAFYERFERKYSPDQPRVPAGSSDGGQWTSGDGGASGESDKIPSNARPAQYEIGTLIGQAIIRNGIGRMCFYRFSFGIVMVPGATNLGCLSTMPSAGAVHGKLITNDN
jgi:hypothetical protein